MDAKRFFNESDLKGIRPKKIQRFLDGYIEDPLSNEPTYLTFELSFDISNEFDYDLGMYKSPLLGSVVDGTGTETPSARNTAEAYLRSLANNDITANFSSFKTIFNKIFSGYDYGTKRDYEGMPWIIQSLDGVPNLWKSGFDNMATGNKTKDVVIKFETLESVNMLMTAMAYYYKKSVYDMRFMRERLPRNLRYFKMSIYVAEFRNLYMLVGKIPERPNTNGSVIIPGNVPGDQPTGIDGNETLSYFKNYASVLKFDCSLCEFDFSETVGAEQSLSVHTPNMAKNKFAIKVGWFEEDSSFMTEAQSFKANDRPDEVKETIMEAKDRRNMLQKLGQRARDAAYGMWANSATRNAGISTIDTFKRSTSGPNDSNNGDDIRQ